MSNKDFRDKALTAAVIAGLLKLEAEFAEAQSDHLKTILIGVAADLLDKTVPDEYLRTILAEKKPSEGQTQFILNNREHVAVIPPPLWNKKLRFPLNTAGTYNYPGLRALERVLRQDFSNVQKTNEVINAWLWAVWEAYPELKAEFNYWCIEATEDQQKPAA